MFLCTLFTTLASAATAGAPAYAVTDVTPPNFVVSRIGDQGHIAGTLDLYVPFATPRATLLRDGTVLDLGTLPGRSESIATSVNDQDEVVGFAKNSDDWARHAFLWQDGAMTDLGSGTAVAINDVGQIVGDSDPDGGRGHIATRWDGTTKTFLGALPGDDTSFAGGINHSGQVVGSSGSGEGSRAFFYDGTMMVHVGDLGDPYDGRGGVAAALNDAGDVVGWVPHPDGLYDYEHAFLWHKGITTDLTPYANTIGHATAINNRGQVVGSGYVPPTNDDPSFYKYAFVYTGGRTFDLNDLIASNTGWVLEDAASINAAGQIVGTGTLNGESRTFLLTPKKKLAVRRKP